MSPEALSAAFENLDAVPVWRAARLLNVSVRTIYRYLAYGRLERVPRASGKEWVSKRSITFVLTERYGSTQAHDLLSEIS